MYRVGMIGLGKLGLPIVRNLVERDFQISGYRRSGSPERAALGGTVAGSPAEVAGHADILLSILPNAAAVEAVVFGPAGTSATMLQDTDHIEMSNIDVARKGRIRDAVRGRGGDLLGCPIGGSPAWSPRDWPPPSPPPSWPASTRSGTC